MRLILSNGELQALIKNKIIKSYNEDNDEYSLELKSVITSESFTVIVAVDDTVDEDIAITMTKESIEPRTIDEWFVDLKKTFPANTCHGKFVRTNPLTMSVNLRTGKNAERDFIDNVENHKLTPQQMIIAATFQMYRLKESSIERNNLNFMPRLGTWLNDTMNIEAQYEEALADDEFMYAYKNNLLSEDVKATRKEKDSMYDVL